MASYTSSAVFGFPIELTQHILSFCHPWDVASFSKTCRAAYVLIYQASDQYLWSQLYVNRFDLPKLEANPSSIMKEKFNWKQELTTRMAVELALLRGPVTQMARRKALEILITSIHEICPTASTTGSSLTINWLKLIISNSNILSNLYSRVDSHDEDSELHARLRCCLTMIVDSAYGDKSALQLYIKQRDRSRAYVYDLRNYRSHNKWGPFKPGGAVNWIHVEHLINVIALNVRELPGNWSETRPPSCLDPAPRSVTSGPPHDWAGVGGTWRRYVCFMDYRDLYAFNFTDLADGPRNPRFFRDPFREATRLIEVKIQLMPNNNLQYHRLPEGSAKSIRFPPLCFQGTSKGVNGNEAVIEGYVVMGIDGVPRWQLTSIYGEHPQWSSTGVQIGGPKSCMGVVGVWTTSHHDQDDPVGPFWLWKVEDDAPTQLMEFT